MELKSEYSEWELADALWSEGKKTQQRLSDYWSEIYASLEEMFGDGESTLTDVNDYLWFTDDDEILENAGISVTHWNELFDLLDGKLIDKGIKEIEDFIENLDSEDSSYENDKEDAEQVLMALEHLEDEIDDSVNEEEITDDLSVIIATLDGSTAWMIDNDKLNRMISEISSWISEHE